MVWELQGTESRHAQGIKYDIIILELQGIEPLTPNNKILKILNYLHYRVSNPTNQNHMQDIKSEH